jgi:hypothetical protein
MRNIWQLRCAAFAEALLAPNFGRNPNNGAGAAANIDHLADGVKNHKSIATHYDNFKQF